MHSLIINQQQSFPLILLFTALAIWPAAAQIPDHIYHPNIKSVKLYKKGDIYSYPVISLHSGEELELHFDDLDGDTKNYYYTFQLCNADWSPANIQPFDYIRGFQSTRIGNYRYSSISATKYTHYQALLPERSSVPTRSGNYLLKVFLNNDTSRLAFTKRFLVVEKKSAVGAQVLQPFGGQLFKTHQRIQVAVNLDPQLKVFTPQDLKVVILQNYIWPTALINNRPTIYRGSYFEYSTDEGTTFPAGKEWRWIDLRSFRLRSERMDTIITTDNRVDIYVKPDAERQSQIYVYYRDLEGLFTIETLEKVNPYWQGDYAHVHFTFIPPGLRAYEGKNIYLFGELTQYRTDESSRMIFNEETGKYEKSLFLKQGYYNYSYVTVPAKKEPGSAITFENTEGNYWGTENTYMVLVYYRAFGARADELVGFTQLNSLRSGF
jgi:hypothetical protein